MRGFKKNQNDLWIKLNEIKESGYRLSCSKNKEWIGDVVSDIKDIDFTFIDDIRIRIEIFRTGRSFFVSGLINTSIRICCVRCLDDFDFPLEAALQYNLYPSDEREFSAEIEINREHLDVLYYQGDSIDIVPLIREQILLNIPSYPLCRESCEGICLQCGSNLNQDPCQCDKQEVAVSKFEILKHFPVKH
jgi:uncharacterized protein